MLPLVQQGPHIPHVITCMFGQLYSSKSPLAFNLGILDDSGALFPPFVSIHHQDLRPLEGSFETWTGVEDHQSDPNFLQAFLDGVWEWCPPVYLKFVRLLKPFSLQYMVCSCLCWKLRETDCVPFIYVNAMVVLPGAICPSVNLRKMCIWYLLW